jgi:putative ABC transport system substrate-binding protein
MIQRRDFVTLLGGAAAWPLAAHAVEHKPVRIGFVFFGSPSNVYDQSLVKAFREGLRQVGLVENQDIVLDVVWISGDPEKAVAEVLGRGAELLIPSGSGASVAAIGHPRSASWVKPVIGQLGSNIHCVVVRTFGG